MKKKILKITGIVIYFLIVAISSKPIGLLMVNDEVMIINIVFGILICIVVTYILAGIVAMIIEILQD